ncbi:MAG: T9SS type A sorting domain-containing protein [bacterium]
MRILERCITLLCVMVCAAFAQYGFDFMCMDDTIQSGSDLIEFHFRLENTGSLPDSYAVDCRVIDSVPGWFEIFCAGGACAEPGIILYDYLEVGAIDTFVKISVWPTSGYAVEILNLHIQSVAEPTLRDSINVYAVGEASIEEKNANIHGPQHITVKPNPVTRVCAVKYQLYQKTTVRMSLLTAYGKVVWQTIDENRDPGSHEYVLDISNLPQGVYFLKLDTMRWFDTEKVIILK